uniref:Putative secreted peptide n=1 Tax=Anopheles braziliensis TaxID=58242 RepID=A0A2M3ZVA3_9DIPT
MGVLVLAALVLIRPDPLGFALPPPPPPLLLLLLLEESFGDCAVVIAAVDEAPASPAAPGPLPLLSCFFHFVRRF